MIDTVLWDFNGTLLEDIDLTLDLNNRVLAKRGLPATSVEEYRRIFRFPVRDYYLDMGIAPEDFTEAAQEWADGYACECLTCRLRSGSAEAAMALHLAGLRQVILSASEQRQLDRQVSLYPVLNGLFDEVLGVSDVYASGKVALALDYLHRSGLDIGRTVFIGDTTHDAEVAKAIGCRCLLISGGHQANEVLETAGVPVMPDFETAVRWILSQES